MHRSIIDFTGLGGLAIGLPARQPRFGKNRLKRPLLLEAGAAARHFCQPLQTLLAT
jgi:hypothetical protein